MEFDRKEILSLLAGHRSEEARRAHRNLTITSFILICAKLLDTSLTDINAFGISPFEKSEAVVLAIVATLLIYWLGMFLIHWSRDREIMKERTLLLMEYMKPILERHAYAEVKIKAQKNPPSDWPEIKSTVIAYRAQQVRTSKAAKLYVVAEIADVAVPLALALGALFALGHWFYMLVSVSPPP